VIDSWTQLAFEAGVAKSGDVTVRLRTNEIEFASTAGNVVVEDAAIATPTSGIQVWMNSVTRAGVLVGRSAPQAYRLFLDTMRVEQLDPLFRGDDIDLRFINGRQAPDSSLLLLYERGLVCIESIGAIRWHRLHDDISARVVEVTEDAVLLETQWPVELAGHRVAYSLRDGREAS
jgi:hypothetical protein